jgi:hypothetical protein
MGRRGVSAQRIEHMSSPISLPAANKSFSVFLLRGGELPEPESAVPRSIDRSGIIDT